MGCYLFVNILRRVKMNLVKEFDESLKTENLLNISKMAWEKLFNALDSYSTIFIDLMYSQGEFLKKIKEALEKEELEKKEDRFKYCSEAVKFAVNTIIKCLKIDPDYDSSKDSFLDILKHFIHYLSNPKERKILDNILSSNNLVKLSGKINDIIVFYSTDLEKEDREALKNLHSDLTMNLSKLRKLLIIYNGIRPNKAVFGAKEALGTWIKSDQNFKDDTLNEWEREIQKWKKDPNYFENK
jgi:hypothetical protein